VLSLMTILYDSDNVFPVHAVKLQMKKGKIKTEYHCFGVSQKSQSRAHRLITIVITSIYVNIQTIQSI